jgi:hypothetical protein
MRGILLRSRSPRECHSTCKAFQPDKGWRPETVVTHNTHIHHTKRNAIGSRGPLPTFFLPGHTWQVRRLESPLLNTAAGTVPGSTMVRVASFVCLCISLPETCFHCATAWQADLRILCPAGGCAPIDQSETCNMGMVAAHAVVGLAQVKTSAAGRAAVTQMVAAGRRGSPFPTAAQGLDSSTMLFQDSALELRVS